MSRALRELRERRRLISRLSLLKKRISKAEPQKPQTKPTQPPTQPPKPKPAQDVKKIHLSLSDAQAKIKKIQ